MSGSWNERTYIFTKNNRNIFTFGPSLPQNEEWGKNSTIENKIRKISGMRLITYTNLKKYIYIFRAQNIFRWFQLNYCAGKETEIYRWFTNYPNKYFVPNKTRPRTQSWLKFCWLCLKLLFKKVLFFLLTNESYTDYNVSKTDEIKHFFFSFRASDILLSSDSQSHLLSFFPQCFLCL